MGQNEDTFCRHFFEFSSSYLSYIITLLSLLLNVICLAVFAKITRQQRKENVYKYLLVKSVADTYVSLAHSAFVLHDTIFTFGHTNSGSLSKVTVYLVFGCYLSMSMHFVSIVCAIMSSCEVYRNSTGKFKIIDRVSHRIAIVIVFMGCYGFYGLKMYTSMEMIIVPGKYSSDMYLLITNSNMYFAELIMVYAIPCLVITVNNILLAFVIKSTRGKNNLHSNKSASTSIECTKVRPVAAIFAVNLLASNGLALNCISLLMPTLLGQCFDALSFLVFWSLFEINLILYYLFDTTFRLIVNEAWVRFFAMIGLKK